MKRTLFIIFLSLLCASAVAQTVTVEGKVTDASGDPLPGVFVLEKGNSQGTTTDSAGDYSIKVPYDATLVFTCIGYKEQVVSVRGREKVDVILEEDLQLLDEIVVIGYGTQKSKDLTAPVVNIKGEDLSRHVASSPMSGIQGRVAGVQITGSGAPGASPSVKIRGTGSIG